MMAITKEMKKKKKKNIGQVSNKIVYVVLVRT